MLHRSRFLPSHLRAPAASEERRPADGDVPVEAGDHGGVDGGRHRDLRHRQQQRNDPRVHVQAVPLGDRTGGGGGGGEGGGRKRGRDRQLISALM